ncbi:MAG TPA: phytanoyl-CoA dioxygenase family protein [Pararhizobium sp.]|uniref:phytanoyl-CoA dioxygenase family protein n=1 Tax=Pararhizobium sp. TaxID=1977563 RepID=UPI002BA38578|nr:phytanoyl-CoA dioxygenase family protein [Pararhizobium sp.]HTO30616.1 phytanoyl-CoA dioxygenase family protein [Pararhizobium sp.]
MNTFPDRLLIEARDASIQLEQLAIDDLDKNIDGYLPPNWRTRRMIESWRSYVASGGRSTEADYANFRTAFTETEGRSNKVFSDVLATHTRKVQYDMSQTMFGDYVKKPGEKGETTVTMLNGEDGEDQNSDAWTKVINGAARHLELHGWWKSKVFLPDSVVKSLSSKIMNQLVKDNGDAVQAAVEGKDGAPMQIKLNSRFATTFEEMYEIASDPLLMSIVQAYMGVPPIFNTPVSILNSFVKPKNSKELSDTAQLFHHDMHRLGFVKIFVYLTDVELTSGPHTLVRGTHRKRPSHLWADGRHTDVSIAQAGLADDVIRITGKAGSVMLVDTSCLHKGAHPDSESRLLASIQYTNSLFGKPIAMSDRKVEASLSSKNDNIQEVAALVRKYAVKSGARFMQNFI